MIPVSIICFVGYIFGINSIFQKSQANTLLSFVGLIGVPAIIINILINIDFENLDFFLCFLYLLSELFVYFIGIFIAIYFFKTNFTYSILIGMAASFSNHVLYVYPIALLEFNRKEIMPIEGIITIDCFILTITLILLDYSIHKKNNISNLLFNQMKNPALIGLILGIIIINFKEILPIGVERTFSIISNSAAPCSLFAIGILLAQKMEKNQFNIAIIISLLKLFFHPLIAFIIIIFIFKVDLALAKTTLMVSVAPVGVMALTFAPKYNIQTDAIARSILWTFLGSQILVPLFGSLD